MSYETLDTIADAYTPMLALCALLSMVVAPVLVNQRWRIVGIRAVFLLLLLVLAYGLMLLDNTYQLWLHAGMDYSTHTAVSLVLVLFLSGLLPKRAVFFISSLVLYIGLMLYQQYHSFADIFSTLVVLLIIITAVFYLVSRLLPQKVLQAALPVFYLFIDANI